MPTRVPGIHRPRVAFLVWNQFQIAHFAEMMRHFVEPDVVLIDRDTEAFRGFDPLLLTNYGAYTRFLSSRRLKELDGQYDVLFTQFTPPSWNEWESTKLVMCQYSMAKPRTAFNARWFMADLGLVYGQYSANIIGNMCPTASVGNPRFDPLFEGRLLPEPLQAIRRYLDPEKATVLYLPTWGDLATSETFNQKLEELKGQYNVILRPHHMDTIAHGVGQHHAIEVNGEMVPVERVLDVSPYLYEVSDVVVSDVSGAIFDALYCGVPVVRLRASADFADHNKAHPRALEMTTDEIGPVVLEDEPLGPAIDRALRQKPSTRDDQPPVERWFSQRGGCGPLVADAVTRLLAGDFARPTLGEYAGDQVRQLIRSQKKRRAKNAKSKVRKGANSRLNRVKRWILRTVSGHSSGRAALRVIIARLESSSRHASALRLYRVLVEERPAVAGDRGFFRPTEVLGPSPELLGVLGSAAKRSSKAMREYAQALSAHGTPFDQGTLVEDWLRSQKTGKSASLYPVTSLASSVRFSPSAWALGTIELAYAQLVEQEEPNSRRIRTLHALGLVETAETVESTSQAGENDSSAALREVRTRLGNLSELLEAAGGNQFRPPESRMCLGTDHSMIVKRALPAQSRLFELAIPLSLAQPDRAISDGIRETMMDATRNVWNALSEEGFTLLPRIQGGFRGNALISGRHPSMTWHTTRLRSPSTIHAKVGSFQGHVVLDSGGFSGWASISTMPNEELQTYVDEAEAEANWRDLYQRLVEGRKSKYQQSSSVPPKTEGYFFLPLQVVDDIVAVHSYIDVLTLLQTVSDWARRKHEVVVVKRHPLCTSSEVAHALEAATESKYVIASDASVHDLIAGAKCVLTVNSGVGAEALLHLKPVVTTGSADYAAATVVAQDPDELLTTLEGSRWEALDAAMIKRFLWTYTKEYMPHARDYDAIRRIVLRLVNHA